MTETEHLLTCLSEECAEVAQRASKALRFGLYEVQPGQDLNNSQRIAEELVDLEGVLGMLRDRGLLPERRADHDQRVEKKKAKVAFFMDYARRLGKID